MGVTANTNQTYSVSTIREDLQDALISIAKSDAPFMSAIGTKKVSNTYFEWAEVDLAAASSTNRVIEGESAPAVDAPTNAIRYGQFTQISDKVVSVSDTSEMVNGVASNHKIAQQLALKLRELKLDMETMLVGSNSAASAGASGTARASATLSAFLKSNVSRGVGGASGTLSGTTSGYANAAATDGTLRALTETMLNDVIASCWTNGGEPSIVLCGSGNKRKISQSFTGNATRYKDVVDKSLSAAVDVYISDFGTVSIVPSRHVRSRDIFVLSPSYAKTAFLQNVTQKPLARTGHAENRLISAEYGLQVDSEKAHGVIADINPAL